MSFEEEPFVRMVRGPIPMNYDAGRAQFAAALPAKSKRKPSSISTDPRRCAWPMWKDDEKPTQEFCGADTVPCCSYCAYHRAQAAPKPWKKETVDG